LHVHCRNGIEGSTLLGGSMNKIISRRDAAASACAENAKSIRSAPSQLRMPKRLGPSHHSELDHQMIISNENQAQVLLIRWRTIDSRGGTKDGRESREFWTRLKRKEKQADSSKNK
jgi:hypothetical protein